MPKLNIVTIYHFDGALHCGFVVSADQVDFFNAAAVTADNVRLVVRHTGGLRSLLSQPQRPEFMGSFGTTNA
jgi:hypothetical protein